MSNNVRKDKTITLEDTIKLFLSILNNITVTIDKNVFNNKSIKASIYNSNNKKHTGKYDSSIFSTKQYIVNLTSPFAKTISECCTNNNIINAQKLLDAVQRAIKYLVQVRRAKIIYYRKNTLNDIFQYYEEDYTKTGYAVYTYNASTLNTNSTAADEFNKYIANISDDINKYINNTNIPPTAIIINKDNIIAVSAITNYISKINLEYKKWVNSRTYLYIKVYYCHTSTYCHSLDRSRR